MTGRPISPGDRPPSRVLGQQSTGDATVSPPAAGIRGAQTDESGLRSIIAAQILLGLGVGALILGWALDNWVPMLVALLVALSGAALVFRASQVRRRAAETSEVWITDRLVRYHQPGCSVLGNGARPVTLSAAQAAGLEACQICGS